MRAVLDANVIISALLSPGGSPANVLRGWLDGGFELVVSELLLAELERALDYPKLRERVEPSERQELVDLLRREAEMVDDPDASLAIKSPDPGLDYLIALAAAARAVIVSGDGHLLELHPRLPVYAPAAFLALLGEDG